MGSLIDIVKEPHLIDSIKEEAINRIPLMV
jgi:hypothetical protein